MKTRLTFTIVPLVAFVCFTLALAGPLDPPPGPVTPTGKTLTEIEPRVAINAANTPGDSSTVFRITQPGSYYLSDNILGQASKNGIVIAADNVTLDLNGFACIGAVGSGHGITGFAGTESNVAIRNGTVRDWGGSGVYNLGRNIFIAEIRAEANGGYGIGAGAQAVITRCVAKGNQGFAGIGVAYWSTVTDCISRENSGAGFEASSGTVFRGNIAQHNQGSGIRVDSTCVVERNLASDNVGAGIKVGYNGPAFGNRLDDNHVVGNGIGIEVSGDGSTVIRNSARANTINYSVAPGNVFPPVVDASSADTNTNPFANIGF